MGENTNSLLRVLDVARRLTCSKQHVYRLIDSGALPSIRVGGRKGLRVNEAALQRFIESRTQRREARQWAP